MDVVLCSENAKAPTRATSGSAGYDLYAPKKITIMAGKKELVNLEIKIAIPDGYVGFVKSRSGTAVKADIEHGAGVIDSDYRGNVHVLLRNFSEKNYTFDKHERVAQLVLLPAPFFKVNVVKDLDKTKRGEGGFGHTGK